MHAVGEAIKDAHLTDEPVNLPLKPATAVALTLMHQMYKIEVNRHLRMLTFLSYPGGEYFVLRCRIKIKIENWFFFPLLICTK